MNEKLIDQLAEGLQKSKKTWRPWRMYMFMLLIGVVPGIVTTFLKGVRVDIGNAVERLDFGLELLLLVCLMLSAYFMVARTAVPGLARAPQRILWGILALLAILLGLFLRHPHHAVAGDWRDGWHCLALISANALFPILATVHLLRKRAATTRPLFTMAFVLLGSLGAAVAVQHLLCEWDDVWHLVIWHFAVLPFAVLFAQILGPKVLRW